MMAFTDHYPGDSDADDEYERSVLISPHLAEDSEGSPTDSEAPSAENTPTTYGMAPDDRHSPKTRISDWTTDDCAKFAGALGLLQYRESFLENEIVGEALIALKHDELKEMGISSVGHRLTILKSVYELKVKQGLPIDPDHYIPLSADQSSAKEVATQDDIALLIDTIRKRDERLMAAEAELRKLADDYRRLREELLPVFRMAKDKSQPLPYQPMPSQHAPTLGAEQHGHEQTQISPSFLGTQEKSVGLTRTISKRLFPGVSTPKLNSPTHNQQSIPEGRTYTDSSTLEPSAAANAASNHLTASMNNGQPSPKGLPSPTSPNSFYNQGQTLGPRTYSREQPVSNSNAIRTIYDHPEESQSSQRQERSNNTTQPASSTRPEYPSPSAGGSTSNSRNPPEPSSGPSVEIFKSFRISMDDPCYKVLPNALKKYNIHEDWRLYALYIVHGDQERCLGLEEKPLILFKQLDRDGRKPMFMLRKHAQMVDGQITNIYPGGTPASGIGIPAGASFDSGGPGGTSITLGGASGGGISVGGSTPGGVRAPSAIQLPGGVL
ncbi:Adaptor for signal transduction [Myotisia sp. PD_48]|nr:Adaptor for signal transduction [Myotisia sp. PD_48]